MAETNVPGVEEDKVTEVTEVTEAHVRAVVVESIWELNNMDAQSKFCVPVTEECTDFDRMNPNGEVCDDCRGETCEYHGLRDKYCCACFH